jgi:simple sugar transport system ATP-binding protein
VLRKGKATASGLRTAEVTLEALARLMVGREVIFRLQKKSQEPGKTVLQVENLYATNDKGLPALQGISLQVRSGEIVGLAGVAGNGQRELAQVITGLRKCSRGTLILNDEAIANRSPRFGIDHGVAHVPEDRTAVGTAPNLSVTDNVIMKKYRQQPLASGWILNMHGAREFAQNLKESYDIIAPNIDTPVRLLSGGNLQRVILAREISGNPALMVAVQPTRGLDVGAIEGVHRLLLAQREAGSAILLVSEELEELLSLSDRVYVIYEGKIMGEVCIGPEGADEKTVESIGLMMTGTPVEITGKEQASHG